ncbi:putative replication-associated protein [Chaetoceros sp. DNA virus 7]|uniref:Replication-associated protein n=1 Tax=Chaetoceros protobacilladnavirus 2 TaxID=3052702 RepID=REP_CPBDV|nr:putative replication-associated protein [Chaetoceros sp. DNA virus 7]W6JGV7.1 RecName: Full=Replication-associated protein; Short=Rep; AltName: Full=Viral protein 3; Short=VP3 [Protobacilladnavirus chaetoc]BAO48208.1 putative replication-associated protein [Chaetoceros sp. DNA virus 7]
MSAPLSIEQDDLLTDDLKSWLSDIDFSNDNEEAIEMEPSDIEMSSPPIDIETSPPEEADVNLDDTWATVQKNGNNKLNRFILTFFPSDMDTKWLEPETYFENSPNKFDCWTGQYEYCPDTGKLHAHIYIECNHKHRIRFNVFHREIRKYHQSVQLQLAKRASKKQRQSAINYVTADFKRAPGSLVFRWEHNKFPSDFDPKCVNKKSKSDKVSKDEQHETQRLWIESKPRHWTWDQIVHENEESKKLLFGCTAGEKYHKGRHAEDARRTINDVIIFYGAGGTGKTTEAQAWGSEDEPVQECRYYRRNPDDGAFWGGGRTCYKGQRIVHYEEFAGQEAFGRLKEVCDIGKHGPAVNVKNGGALLNHDTVIFTSNIHPAGWFHKLWESDPKQWMPFERRITQVRFYPSHRADGSLNQPDENNPPYFIDQTEEFRQFVGDYDKAKEHAELHWPLKEAPEPTAQVFVPGRSHGVTENTFFEYCKTGRAP